MSFCSLKSLPVALAVAAVSIASLGIGFHLGSRGVPPSRVTEMKVSPSKLPVDDEDSDGAEDLADGDISSVAAGFMEPCKLVLVVRTDLKMTSGKIAAQCGHATLACYKALLKKNPQLVQHWERTGQAKIALKADTEEQILELEAMAKSLNLCARAIQDAGRTQVEAGSRTVLGIGPAPVQLVNQVTGDLRLL